MVTQILNVMPLVLGTALCLFLVIGFWQGLDLRPHAPEHRSNLRPFWWRWW